MLYIVTIVSDRAAAISSAIKASLVQVQSVMDQQGIAAAGDPLAILSDWTGRLVTVEAGFPVTLPVPPLAASRVQLGATPGGLAARRKHAGPSVDHAWCHARLADDLRATGHRLTGIAWEVYTTDPASGAVVTWLYAQLLAPPETALQEP